MASLLPATNERAPLPSYKPSAADEKMIRDAIAFLTMTAPFWSHLLYSQMQIVYTRDVPWAATDGHAIFINPEGMKNSGWGIEEIAFVLAHEVCHFVLGDLIVGTVWRETGKVLSLPYDHRTMNMALDYRINAMLVEAKVGKMPKEGCYDVKVSAKGMESAVDIYSKLFANMPPPPPGGEGFDEHLEPSEQDIAEDKTVGKIKRAQAVAAAVQAAQTAGMGNLPSALKTLIGELLQPKVKWQERLRSTMQRATGTPALDWRRLNRRLISRPERIAYAKQSKYGCGTIIVGYDTSGSCVNPETQRRFFSEMSAIVTDLNPAELIVVWCDAAVQRVDRLEEPSDLEHLRREINDLGGAPGGGGTDFRPVFDWVRDNFVEPDVLVFLTDTYGTFPDRAPDYETIWASIGGDTKVPFGELIEVEL